jgi:hypothetical protein
MKKLNVGIVGYKFMGRAHSNAWRQAPLFFNLDVHPSCTTTFPSQLRKLLVVIVCHALGGPFLALNYQWGSKILSMISGGIPHLSNS